MTSMKTWEISRKRSPYGPRYIVLTPQDTATTEEALKHWVLEREKEYALLHFGDKKTRKFTPPDLGLYEARNVVRHPKTGRLVSAKWREERVAEIEGQVEDLMAEMKKLREEA